MQHLPTRISAKGKISAFISGLPPAAPANWHLLLTLLLLGPGLLPLRAQTLPLNSLFRPIARLGYDQVQVTQADGGSGKQQLGISTTQAQLMIPLSTRLGIETKPLNLRASQVVYQLSAAQQQYDLQQFNPELPLSRGSFSTYLINTSIFAVKASVRGGVWGYGARLSVNDDFRKTSHIRPSILVGVMRGKVKSLKSMYGYGLAVSASDQMVLPIPVAGAIRRFGSNFTLTALFPLQLRLQYRISRTLQLSSVTAPIIRRAFVTIAADSLPQRREVLNNQGLRTGLQLTVRFTKKLRLYSEAGLVPYQRFFVEGHTSQSVTSYPNLYATFNLTYSFGSSLFETQLAFFD